MLLMIDNYDSFTYNLVQYFGELGEDVVVYRNDKISIQEIEALKPRRLVISPGPCTPNEAGISVEAIRHFGGKLPLLGVCLGHQSLAVAFGGEVIRAERLMHGKTSMVQHDGHGVFAGMASPFEAGRYHSLVVPKDGVPPGFVVSAWVEGEDTVMGLRHASWPVHGVQFHPESVLTPAGHQLLRNFLEDR